MQSSLRKLCASGVNLSVVGAGGFGGGSQTITGVAEGGRRFLMKTNICFFMLGGEIQYVLVG
jgi:hypothetical protein